MCACRSLRSIGRSFLDFAKLLILAPLMLFIFVWWYMALAVALVVLGTILVVGAPIGLVAKYVRNGRVRQPSKRSSRPYQVWRNELGSDQAPKIEELRAAHKGGAGFSREPPTLVARDGIPVRHRP